MCPYEQFYTVCDAASLCGIAVQTLKRYEADGLIIVRRDSRGARLYSEADIALIRKHVEARATRHGKTGRRRLVFATSTTSG
jgi:DNA-binding transcriptional MerR regulator